MVKFASDCMAKMNIVTESLLESLGPDTADLAMRVGLHSGSVTAGVLRGQKSRFQLFGDTVNTASRMESNGQRGRIQVSQATADALFRKGKSDWLVRRDGTVSIKGKGDMQTYWIDPASSSILSPKGGSTTKSSILSNSMTSFTIDAINIIRGEGRNTLHSSIFFLLSYIEATSSCILVCCVYFYIYFILPFYRNQNENSLRCNQVFRLILLGVLFYVWYCCYNSM
jgi:hypothetical protein